jgi:hypothetical protein
MSKSNVVELPAPEPEVKPWTIKGVSPEARNAAIAAAERAHMTQGEWLTRNIPLMVQAEKNQNRLPTVVGDKPAPAAEPVLSIGEISNSLDIAERLASITGKSVPRSITRAIEKQVKAHLGVAPSARKAS